MKNPIRHIPTVIGAFAIVVVAAVGIPATPAAARSVSLESLQALPAMYHDHHAAAGATQVLAATATVDIVDFSFSPASISVTAGTTVTWTNRGAKPHTVTGTGFDSGLMSPGATFSFTFATAGTFSYVCDFHSQMTGTVVVTAGTAATPPSTTPPPPITGGPTVDMRDNSFSPASLTVAAGTTVTWVNRGTAMHTVTTNDALFHSGLLAPGKRFSYTFTLSGTYPYLCAIHPAMTGMIVVTGVAATPPAAATAPPTPAPIPAPVAAPVKAPTAPAPATGSIATVAIADNNFTPGVTTVPAGTTVVWENHGLVKHTVTSSGPTVFDSGILSKDGRFSVTFSKPGSYPYICEIHPGMTGAIDVVGDNGAAPAAAAPSPTPAAVAALPGGPAPLKRAITEPPGLIRRAIGPRLRRGCAPAACAKCFARAS